MTLSNKRKRVVFVTGTRADFGKQKSLISILQSNPKFDVHVFVTGMHLDKKYGYTIQEIYNSKIKNIFEYNNSTDLKYNFIQIGKGSLGGKARGLAFANKFLNIQKWCVFTWGV